MLMLVKQKIHNGCKGYRDAKDDNQTTAEVANEIKVNVSNRECIGRWDSG
jgi:hypothetical protein